MAVGTCPKCGTFVRTLDAHRTPIAAGELRWKGVTFHCPNPVCRAVLGCQVDPVALTGEIVQGVMEELKKLMQI